MAKRGMRKFSWFILAVNALFLIWVIGGVSSSTTCATANQAACEAGQTIGKGIGVALILVFWAIVDVILLVIWLVTKPKEQPTVIYVDRQSPAG